MAATNTDVSRRQPAKHPWKRGATSARLAKVLAAISRGTCRLKVPHEIMPTVAWYDSGSCRARVTDGRTFVVTDLRYFDTGSDA